VEEGQRGRGPAVHTDHNDAVEIVSQSRLKQRGKAASKEEGLPMLRHGKEKGDRRPGLSGEKEKREQKRGRVRHLTESVELAVSKCKRRRYSALDRKRHQRVR
jgi:hypothetical protein